MPNMSPVARLFGIHWCFAACMDLRSTEVLLEQEHQQLLQVRQSGVPSQGEVNTLSKLVEEVFDGAIILCFEERCNRHKTGGGIWPPQAQSKIVIINGADTDREFGLENETNHRVGASTNHLMAVEAAASRGWNNVLILEDDIQETGLVRNSAEFVSAVKEFLSKRSWSGLKLTASYHNCSEMGKEKLSCKLNCLCESVPEWINVQNISVCQTSAGNLLEVGAHSMVRYRTNIEDFTNHCDFRSSAAYALHASAFGPFMALLEDLRKARWGGSFEQWRGSDARNVIFIDKFVAVNVPNMLHVLPLLVLQTHHSPLAHNMAPDDDWELATDFSSICKV